MVFVRDCFLLLLLCTGFVYAEGIPCHVEMANGDEADMIIHAVAAGHLKCSFAFLPDSILEVEHERIRRITLSDEQPAPPETGDQIQLQDYSMMYGAFKKIEKNEVWFDLESGPSLRFPVAAVSRISRLPVNKSQPDLVPRDKLFVVRTKGGDRLSGQLRQLSDDSFKIENDELSASLVSGALNIIQFPMPELLPADTNKTNNAKTAEPAVSDVLYVELHTLNGGRLYGQEPVLQGNELAFNLSSGTRISVAMDRVKTIAFTRSMIPNSRAVLVWEKFADQDEESERTVKILKEGLKEWTIHRHKDAPAGAEFRARLLGSRALVVPEMENLRNIDGKVRVGEGPEVDWKDLIREQVRPILADYVRRGGRIVFLCLEPEHQSFIKALNLIDYEVGDRSREAEVKFTVAGRKISTGIGDSFVTTDATAFYKIKAPAVAWAVDEDKLAPIFFQQFGPGSVIVMGMDYFEQNEATETLLLNAVRIK